MDTNVYSLLQSQRATAVVVTEFVWAKTEHARFKKRLYNVWLDQTEWSRKTTIKLNLVCFVLDQFICSLHKHFSLQQSQPKINTVQQMQFYLIEYFATQGLNALPTKWVIKLLLATHHLRLSTHWNEYIDRVRLNHQTLKTL